MFGDLKDYVERQRFGGSLWWAVSPTLGHNGATILLGLGLALLVAFVALREHVRIDQVARSCLLVLGSLLLVVSYVQPWHALWLLPFFAVVVAPGWLWLSGTLPLLYLFGLELELPVWVRPVVVRAPCGVGRLEDLLGATPPDRRAPAARAAAVSRP